MSEMHPRTPWRDIAFVGAFWNCGDRLEKLLVYVRPWFRTIVAVVQESPDNTLEVARKYADIVIEDPWVGRGDPSIAKGVANCTRRFAFVVSDDEWPTEDLLNSFQDLATKIVEENKGGAWVHFVSTIDGIDFTREQDEHLRLFDSRVTWPSSQHARPMIDNAIRWRPTPDAYVRHDRTLDEMMRDYTRRYSLGLTEGATEGQMEHNRRMMRGACEAVATHKGWAYITEFEWWPTVVQQAYGGIAPEASTVPEEPAPTIPAPRRRGRPRKTKE